MYLMPSSILIIIATRDHFLASGSQDNGVLILSRVAALGVAQWWIRLDNTLVAQILESHLVFGGTSAIQPTFTERQRAKVFVDGAQQLFGRLQTQRNEWQVEVLHVMRAIHVVMHQTTTRGAECFDGIELILLHARRFATFHNGHRFASMNA